ncbi:E3 ubiquitin-protein ligase rnf146-like [Cloeon dipterum]|uniref:E3 ubiquitin-protein ligase rnf146-like n=1 Tax=Cloeon dipterum TaxID=197152 RepID=UPI00321FBF40
MAIFLQEPWALRTRSDDHVCATTFNMARTLTDVDQDIVSLEDEEGDVENDTRCPICLLALDMPMRLPCCGHLFCFDCSWGKIKRCAMCRAFLPLDFWATPEDFLSCPVPEPATQYSWIFKTTSGWWRFSWRQEQAIRRALSAGICKLSLTIAGEEATLDFRSLLIKQHRKVGALSIARNGTFEAVGVAGLKLSPE